MEEWKKGNTAYSISLKSLLSSGITTYAVNKHPFNENSKNLFDEFDSIATQRKVSQNSADNKIRRVLNSLLQFIENNNSQSFIIVTNNMKIILDLALLRRFDVVFHYPLPDQRLRKLMFQR